MDCDINASKYRCLGLSGYPASSCFAIFHSIVPSAEIQCSGLLESRALKFGMFLWGVPAGPAEPAELAGPAGPRARVGPRGVWTGGRPFSGFEGLNYMHCWILLPC